MNKGHQRSAPAASEETTEQKFERLERELGAEVLAFFSTPRRRLSWIEPQDLAQMTMLRVYRGMETFRHEASPRTWVLKIATNVWANALRDGEADKRSADEVSIDASRAPGEAPIDPPDRQPDPQERLLAEERTRLLLEAIDELPKKMRRCMMLRYRDDLSIRDIATLLRVEESTVKSHIQEGNRRLGPLLLERFGVTTPPEPTG